MRIIPGIAKLEGALPSPAVAIGNFDGVHRGHREILRLARDKAAALGGSCVVYTFRPHPQQALRPDRSPALLMTYDEKLEALGAAGVDAVIEEPFSREFSTTPAERFFADTLAARLGARAVVVGHDFAFGKGREGGLEALSRFCASAGVSLTVVPPYQVDGVTVSSTRIRECLAAGEVREAARLLGSWYFYRGYVSRGDSRGAKLGFPTANLVPEGKLCPAYGVYATVSVVAGREHPSVTNIGVRPTFQAAGAAPVASVETHLLDFKGDLYGERLEVRFVERLRAERKFDGIEALKRQIADDVRLAREALSRAGESRA